MAEAVHPVPEKAVLADFRHAKTTSAGTSGKKQHNNVRKKKKKKESYDKINRSAAPKQKLAKEKNECCHIERSERSRHTRLGFCNY